MDVVQVAALLMGGMGALSLAVVTLYKALTTVYTAQVKDAQDDRNEWRKQARDAADTIRAQNLVIERAINTVERTK